jgi:hypothetical protein
MSIQDFETVHEPRRNRSLSGNRAYTTVVFPPDVFRKIKARARNNGVSVRDETLRLCAVALRTEEPTYSPPLPERTQEMIDALNSDAAALGGDRKVRAVGHLLDAARMIRKLATQVARLTA